MPPCLNGKLLGVSYQTEARELFLSLFNKCKPQLVSKPHGEHRLPSPGKYWKPQYGGIKTKVHDIEDTQAGLNGSRPTAEVSYRKARGGSAPPPKGSGEARNHVM